MRSNPLGLNRFGCVALAVAASFCASSLQAATRTWSGGNGGWATASNWSPSGVPISGEDVVFNGPGGTVTWGSNYQAYADDLKMESGAYTISIGNGGGTAGTITLNTFSGAALANTTFINGHASSSQTLNLSVSGTTAFNGAFGNGAGTGVLRLNKGGLGFLDLSNATFNHTGNTSVSSGILRLSGASSGAGVVSGPLQVGTDKTLGILEIDAKGSNVTIAKTLGGSAGNIRFGNTSNGVDGAAAGIGALNGNVTITLANANPSITTIAWDNSGSFFRVLNLQLGTEASTHRTILTNDFSMSGSRTITAGNGSAAIDGEFSGALVFTGATAANSVLTKDGVGTMLFSGTSSAFAGRLHVTEGKLLVSGSLASVTANTTYGVKVDTGATLGGGGSIVLSNNAAKMVVDGTLLAGEGFADKTLTLSTNLEMGADSVLSFAIDGTDQSDKIALTGGTSWLFQVNQKVQILDLGASDAGGQFALITGLTGFGSYDFSNWQVTTDSPLTGELVYIGSTLYYQAVPEPSTLAFAGLGLGALVLSFRRRKLV